MLFGLGFVILLLSTCILPASADILCCTILGENDDNLIFDEIAERLPGRIKCISTALDTIRTAPPNVLSEILNKL